MSPRDQREDDAAGDVEAAAAVRDPRERCGQDRRSEHLEQHLPRFGSAAVQRGVADDPPLDGCRGGVLLRMNAAIAATAIRDRS
jgi:hypothetical protein